MTFPTTTPTEPRGLLGRFLSNPGQAQALGLLSSYLMAAGAPTTDPGGGQKFLAEGIRGYHEGLQGAAEAADVRAMRKAQRERLEAQTNAEKRLAAQDDAVRGMLNNYFGGAGGSPGTTPGMPQTGLLSRVPAASLPLLQGLAAAYPKEALKYAIDLTKPTAPEEFTLAPGAARYRGDELIAQQPHRPATPQYMPREEFEHRERFKAGLKPSGGLTLAQQRANKEIDRARRTIQAQDLGREDIRRKTASFDETGLENRQYDDLLEGQLRTAMQPMYGEDPGYAGFYNRFAFDPETITTQPLKPAPATAQGLQSAEPGSTLAGRARRGPAHRRPTAAGGRPTAATRQPGVNDTQYLEMARQALAQGAPVAEVMQVLQGLGIDPRLLDQPGGY